MKTKSLLSSIMLPLWVLSSFGAGPSRTLDLGESLTAETTQSIRQLTGLDVSFAGKLSGSAHGNLMLLLDQPVPWTRADAEGDVSAVEASVMEYDPSTGKVVDAFAVLTPAGEEQSEALALDDLVYNRATGIYFGLDTENQRLYAFEYGPDEPVTIMVERTRMVEVVVPPEPLLSDEEATQDADAESESAEESAVETATAQDVDAESTSAAADETAVPAEEEATVAEAPAEQASEPDTAEPTAEDEQKEEEESTDEAESTDPAPALTEGLAEDPGVAPLEVPAILEEVEEPIVVQTKWVEETYEEPEVVMKRHKFGNALQSYDLSELGMERFVDLSFDPTIDMLLLLGESEDGNWVVAQIRAEAGQVLTRGEAVALHVNNTPNTVFVDPVSKHWVVLTDQSADLHTREGRLLRSIPHTLSVKDVCEIVQTDELGVSEPIHFAATASALGLLNWQRPNEAKVHHVPGEFATIAEALDVATNEDWILLSPGIYTESLNVTGKAVQMVSYFQFSRDLYFTEHTRIQPQGEVGLMLSGDEGSQLYVAGLHFTGAQTAIQSAGQLSVEHCEITGNGVGLQFTGGMATIADCEITGNSEDGVRYVEATATLLERCNVSENGGHGIAVHITPYDGVLYRTVIRRNTLRSNGGSGLYFKDEPIMTQREFRIENNFIIENTVAGVEVDLKQPDPKNLIPTGPRTRSSVYLVNNTIVGNPVGVLRGGNYRMINNIVAHSPVAGIQNLLYNSVIIRNLFWENKASAVDSNYVASNNREEDPLFVGEDYILSVRSPAKGAGIPGNLWNDTSDRSGADIGASR